MRHAFYSAKMAERWGTVVWARSDGTEIECTAVGDPPDGGLKWDDVEDLGEVDHYVRGYLID